VLRIQQSRITMDKKKIGKLKTDTSQPTRAIGTRSYHRNSNPYFWSFSTHIASTIRNSASSPPSGTQKILTTRICRGECTTRHGPRWADLLFVSMTSATRRAPCSHSTELLSRK
jgi:hypothetical protein